MFAVDLQEAKKDLMQKTDELLILLTKNFEEDIIVNYDSVIVRYDNILSLIDKHLNSAEDIVEMDKIKASIGLEITTVIREIDDSYKNIVYLLSINHIFSDRLLEKITETLQRHYKHKEDTLK